MVSTRENLERFGTDTHLSEVLLDVLWHFWHYGHLASGLVGRRSTPTAARHITGAILDLRNPSSIEPLEILGILNRDVAILDDDHEDVLDDRNHEKDEDIHEELGVEEVGQRLGVVRVEEGVSSLHREHGVESTRESTKALLELPEDCH